MEPLNLPRGSIRAILAIIVGVGAIPVAVFAPAEGQTFYAGLVTLVLRDYFHARIVQNQIDGPSTPPPSFGRD